MHALHKIVVKAETLQEAIEKAQDALEPYRMTAYDYYDEDGGPNWGEDYARPLCSAEDQEISARKATKEEEKSYETIRKMA